MRTVTLALTHYNRFWFLQECIDQVLEDERISEIVISDDASTDGSYERLCKRFADNPKIKLFRNETNLDCYANKHQAVLRSTSEWVILFDSDNVIKPSYLDSLFSIEPWDAGTIYCPDFAEPHFNYTSFANRIVDRSNVASMIPMEAAPIHTTRGRPIYARNRMAPRRSPPLPEYSTVLNTCNYFVFRAGYLEVWEPTVNPHTADSIYQAYNWLKSGRKIFVVPGLRYYHRVHDESHYKLNRHKTGSFYQKVQNLLRQLK